MAKRSIYAAHAACVAVRLVTKKGSGQRGMLHIKICQKKFFWTDLFTVSKVFLSFPIPSWNVIMLSGH